MNKNVHINIVVKMGKMEIIQRPEVSHWVDSGISIGCDKSIDQIHSYIMEIKNKNGKKLKLESIIQDMKACIYILLQSTHKIVYAYIFLHS